MFIRYRKYFVLSCVATPKHCKHMLEFNFFLRFCWNFSESCWTCFYSNTLLKYWPNCYGVPLGPLAYIFALSPFGRSSESENARCDKKKWRRCEGEGAKQLSLLCVCNFALSPSHLRTLAFFLFLWVNNIFDRGIYLPEVFRMLPDIIGTHALDSVAVQSCSL